MLDFCLKLSWIPILTALIGWGTNWVAIRMLFEPKKPFSLLGLRLQGLVPKRQKELAAKTAEVVDREILSQHTIRENILKLNLEPYLEDFAHKLVKERLGSRLQAMPMVGAFIQDATLDKWKDIAIEELRKEAHGMQLNIANEVESHLQIRDLVERRIASFDPEKLENVILHVARKELKTIEWLGALLGFVVGLGQVAILYGMQAL